MLNFISERCVFEMLRYYFFQDDLYFLEWNNITISIVVLTIVSIAIINVKVIARHKKRHDFSVKQYVLFIILIPFLASGIVQALITPVVYVRGE
jgi:hypothetical protein